MVPRRSRTTISLDTFVCAKSPTEMESPSALNTRMPVPIRMVTRAVVEMVGVIRVYNPTTQRNKKCRRKTTSTVCPRGNNAMLMAYHVGAQSPCLASGSRAALLVSGRGFPRRCRRLRTWGTSGAKLNLREDTAVDVLVERLDARLREWKPETAGHEQEVLDLLDEPTTR